MVAREEQRPLGPVAEGAKPRASGVRKGVLQGIGFAILSGEFPEGSALPGKDVLMRRFGVSSTPLREALQALAAKGLIAARTKVGTWVREEVHWNMFDADILDWRLEAGIDGAFLGKLFEMRQSVEPTAAALAADCRTAAQVQALREASDAMTGAGSDMVRFTAADLDLHLLVLAASANPFMQSFGAVIRTALAASFSSSAPASDPERARVAVEEHVAIVDAIAERRPQAAAEAMEAVIRTGWRNVGGDLGQPLAGLAVAAFRPMVAGRTRTVRERLRRDAT